MSQHGKTATQGVAQAIAPGSGALADPNFDLAPWSPSGTDVWDRAKAAHLMRRAGFGARPEEIDAIVALGLDRTVDLLLTTPTSGLQEYGTQVLPTGEVLNLTYDLASQRGQWLNEMANTPYQLREKMVLFLTDHFSVGSEVINDVPLKLPHANIFRRHGLGSFRQMLIEVTADPAMLLWLDNNINGRLVNGVPTINENYAREIMELYTMGVNGGYTQNDVVQAARCLSGWTLTGNNRFFYNASWHVTGNKTVLGSTILSAGQQEVYSLIDVLLAWPATAEYMVTKVWKFFVSENPYPALVTELAKRWRADGFNFRALMNIVLRSNYFFSSAARRVLIKNPVEFVINAIRNTATPIYRFVNLGQRVQDMGWSLLRYSNPAGYDDGTYWISTQAMIARCNFAAELTQVSGTAGVWPRFDPAREVVRMNLQTAEEIVDHFLGILVDGDVPPQVRYSLYDFMNRADRGSDPFVLTPAKINEKVRGLVHLILSLPEYQMN